MAAVSATCATAVFLHKSFAGSTSRLSSPSIVGLPALRSPRVTCSAHNAEKENRFMTNCGAPLSAAAVSLGVSNPAFALVDERLTTEGTGLALGFSNSLLVWILVGVSTLIWALYFAYTSSLEEDEESGLSL